MTEGLSVTFTGDLARKAIEWVSTVLNGETEVKENGTTRHIGGTLRVTTNHDKVGWSEEEVTALHGSLNVQTGRVMFDTCAELPGGWISFPQVVKAADVSVASARASLGRLTAHIRSKYGHDGFWPVDVEWGRNIGLEDRIYYRMSDQVARWWKAAGGK